MPYIKLADSNPSKIKIMIFAEGTILKPKSLLLLYNHRTYIPIGNAVALIVTWNQQDAEIIYCTSRKGKQAEEIAQLLIQYGFTGSKLYFRERKQQYKDIIESVQPDMLIEDDCRSIGGSWQMCITHVAHQIKNIIKSIIVKEFKGIDLLFASPIMKKTVKELRKNQGFTASELAAKLKIDNIEILNIDDLKLKDVSEPLKSKLLPILKGNYTDKIPWL